MSRKRDRPYAFQGAKSRILKPTFWQSDTVGTLSDGARLLFLCILSHVDDRGIAKANPLVWRSACWGNRRSPTPLSKVAAYLDELASSDGPEHEGAITRYEVNGVSYLRVTKFAEHNTGLRDASHSDAPLPVGFQVRPGGVGVVSQVRPRDVPDRGEVIGGEVKGGEVKREETQENLTRTRAKKAQRDSRVKELVDSIFESLQAKLGVKPVMPFGQMGKDLTRLLADRQPEEIIGVWSHWLASPDGFTKEHAWSWPMFIRNFSAVDVALKEGKPYGQGHRGRAQANTLPAPAGDFVGGDFFAEPGVDS